MLKDASFLMNDSVESGALNSNVTSESPNASSSNSKKVVSFDAERIFTLKNLNINVNKVRL